MTNKSLEWLVGTSVGIGRTKNEAERALMDVKKNKPFPEEVINSYNNDNYLNNLIQTYQGPTLEDEPNQDVIDKVSRTKERLNKIKDEDSKEIFLEQIKDDCFDSKTGVLTPFGYHLSKKDEGEDKFYLLMDCNDMHYWNDAKSYEQVDERLKSIGASLNSNVRHYRTNDLVAQRDPKKVQRMNGSTGDEFLVELHCREEDVQEIAKRLLKAVHQDQYDVAYNGKELNLNNQYLLDQLDL